MSKKELYECFNGEFCIGRALGYTDYQIAKALYDGYEISYNEMKLFEEEEKKNESRN